MGHPDQPSPSDFQRRRWWVWPTLIGVMLIVHFFGMMWAVAIAKADPSFKVVKNAYSEGIRFDEHKALVAASKALGWTVQVNVDDNVTDGRRPVRVSVVDREGLPITDATVELSLFHDSRGSDTRKIRFDPIDGTAYLGSTDLLRGGFWTFDLSISRGKDHYVDHIASRYVNPVRR
jgi:nitrogen fixation protein FixH